MVSVYEAFAKRSSEARAVRRPTLQRRASAAEDPAYDIVVGADDALREGDFDKAIGYFCDAVKLSPHRTDIRKDLAYVYFKVGENEKARLQFLEVMQLDPTDYHSALEVAFLDYEISDPSMHAAARRIFDRIRKEGDPESRATAERAFQFIEGSLTAQIRTYTEALRLEPDNLNSHLRLARLAEERDEWDLALREYKAAESLGSGQLYLDLARVLQTAGRADEAKAALIRATQTADAYAAEEARDRLAAMQKP